MKRYCTFAVLKRISEYTDHELENFYTVRYVLTYIHCRGYVCT
jgi:hypothetical protein